MRQGWPPIGQIDSGQTLWYKGALRLKLPMSMDNGGVDTMNHLMSEGELLAPGSVPLPAGDDLIRDPDEHFKALPGNVAGKYYVTEECDGCAYCALVAPENFGFDKATNTYFVSRQPQNQAEREMMSEAMDDCPLSAIGPYV